MNHLPVLLAPEEKLRVLFLCTGVGVYNRGIESFFREAFNGLCATPGLEATLCKGAGEIKPNEHVLWTLPRTGALARWVGLCIRRNAYVAEQLTSLPSTIRAIRKYRPQVIFYSDSNLGFLLYRWRRQIGVPYRLLFSNGGPCHPPFNRTDFVHQVAPLYLEEAISAGEPQTKHFLVPYGIRVPTKPQMDASGKRMLRAKLGLPQDRTIVLSVGWISRQHKRMHYVIEELAQLPEPRPFLLLVGAMDESSHEILKLAHDLLGEGNFRALTVTYQEVPNFYRASDLFVLASLQEGFGRVYLEALMHGLPTIGHRHPVIEYVLGDVGILADLSVPGNLTPVIRYQLSLLQAGEAHQNRVLGRIEEVRKRFSWEVLQPQYVQMFRDCATMPLLRNQS